MIALAHYGLRPSDVLAELQRREGTSGIEEKALRKALRAKGREFQTTGGRDMSDIIDVTPKGDEQAQALKSVGWLSYVLHLIVAVGAIVPGAQTGALLLVVALVIDLVKRPEAAGHAGRPAIFRGASAPSCWPACCT